MEQAQATALVGPVGAGAAAAKGAAQAANEALYDRLWSAVPLSGHEGWPIWPELQRELSGRCLEIGAGVLPRSPVAGGFFVDLSLASLRKLAAHGGNGVRAAGRLPFCDGAFSAVCAFEVLEHIPDDEEAMAEIARVLAPGGALLFSVPVDPARFTGFDEVCEHLRRYDAAALAGRLAAHGLHIERWTTQPNRLSRAGGYVVGKLLWVVVRMPRLMRRLKLRAARKERALVLRWRTDDIRQSHQEGGLIAIARRL